MSLDGHDSVRDFAQHVKGREARDFEGFNALEELSTMRSPLGMRLEVISERIGVDEDRVCRHQVGEGHGPSTGGGKSSSASNAKRSASWALPFQPRMP